jgi:ADP-dependent NAD(P)H-hydrate dehydratase / NAD(P)H-hydrate epimerase
MDSLSKVLRKPTAADDKYSRGVVGFITGSDEFPGAAILGVSAALRVGVGMVRYLGPESVGRMLIEVRPEVVLQAGRVQAWVLGSGVTADQSPAINQVVSESGYAVIDAGALDFVDFSDCVVASILTPHAGELARLLARFDVAVTRAEIEMNPVNYAVQAATLTGQTVLLKGNVTTIADQFENHWQTPPASPALATAGSGDVLAGVLGALIAINRDALDAGEISLAQIAFAGAELHARAGANAAESGPVVALDIADSVRAVVKEVIDEN